MANSSREIDMLHGSLFMKILVFALPLAASSILQQLFNSVDVAVVGHFASSEALAAVGSNTPVINLLINLFIGISMGANVVISNHIGQKNNANIQKAINTVAILALICGITLMIVGILVSRPILSVMGTPENVLDMAVVYLRIYFVGIPFFMIFNFGSAILRSKGDTKRPLYILIIAGIINTLLNLLLVIVFHLGVAGVAIATSISNGVSALLIIILLIREQEPYRLHIEKIRIYSDELRKMLSIGIPAGLQGIIFSLSNVLLQTAINGFGSAAIGGSAAALNFESYCYYIVVAFNGAAISFIGQNYGAGLYDRVRRIFWICLSLSVAFCAIANYLFVWQDSLSLSLFSSDPEVLHYGKIRLHYVLAFQAIACSYEVSGSALRGMGKSMLPTLLMVFGTCLLRIVWLYTIFPQYNSFEAIMTVYPVSWIVTGIMVFSALIITLRKQPSVA